MVFETRAGARAGIWAQETAKKIMRILLFLVRASDRPLVSLFLLPREKLRQKL